MMLAKNNKLHLQFVLALRRICSTLSGQSRAYENGLLMEVLAYLKLDKKRGCNSVVECKLPKLDVAGSSPVARFSRQFFATFGLPLVGKPSLVDL